ncbi:MAG: SDR family oxidoreductase [Candidatus Adiutrix sp.]|jgi:3-oxoacyl-[acyl-carrier protein] reductase|nr:SDR family oxidoreductase [Candidatus Adiutrix sp.]
MGKFDGKTVIVTGGVSGIGEGISRAFVAEGANVVMNCLPGEAAGQKLYDELRGQGAKCLLAEGDISNKDSVENMIGLAIKTYGRVHTFISNAAAFDYYKPLLETSEEMWDKLMAVNLRGNFFISKAIVPHFIENKGGNLIFVASIAGLIAGHGGAAYTATKHGVVGLCKQITFDYGSQGVRCNTICPGSIYTPLSGPFLDMPAAKEKLARTPFGTHGQPRHIAAAALFLASDEAEFVHGTTMLVDGGNVVRKW